MKTVRFDKIVEKCGRPEIFLLLSKDDPEFTKALKANRVMSLMGSGGSKTGYGEVGYDPEKRPQILVFPKSLQAFAGSRVVGIHYEEFTEPPASQPVKSKAPRKASKNRTIKSVPPLKPMTTPKPESKTKTNLKPKSKIRIKKEPVPEKSVPKHPPSKIIQFPKDRPATHKKTETSAKNHLGLDNLKNTVRKSLRLLEKGNAVAAYNLLKAAVKS